MKVIEEYANIEVKQDKGVCIVTMNKPESRNALAQEMLLELIHFFRSAKQSEEIRAIILTGKGSAFCSGGNIRGFKEQTAVEARKKLKFTQQLVTAIVELDQPIIAAVNGAAAGAGFSIALACDLILASRKAVFSSSFTKIGLVPDLGAAYFLPKLVGSHIAKQIMLSGEPVSAEKAKSLHIVNELYEEEELLSEAYKTAEKLANGASAAIALTKQLINSSHNSNFKDFLELEASLQGIAFQTDDLQEGVKAFFEKRPPSFIGK